MLPTGVQCGNFILKHWTNLWPAASGCKSSLPIRTRWWRRMLTTWRAKIQETRPSTTWTGKRSRNRSIQSGWKNIGPWCKNFRWIFSVKTEYCSGPWNLNVILKLAGKFKVQQLEKWIMIGTWIGNLVLENPFGGGPVQSTTIEGKSSSGWVPASSACSGYFQYCWIFWVELYQHKPEYWSHGVWLWRYDTLHYSQRWFLFNET